MNSAPPPMRATAKPLLRPLPPPDEVAVVMLPVVLAGVAAAMPGRRPVRISVTT
jgi:hypothetical protein